MKWISLQKGPDLDTFFIGAGGDGNERFDLFSFQQRDQRCWFGIRCAPYRLFHQIPINQVRMDREQCDREAAERPLRKGTGVVDESKRHHFPSAGMLPLELLPCRKRKRG
jgi:hypothetical protein